MTTTKQIRFNCDTRDFDMYLNGEYIGSRASYGEAEAELDRVASMTIGAMA